MKIKYNAPVTLTFSLIATLILVADSFTSGAISGFLFVVPGNTAFSLLDPFSYIRIWSHVLGHANWDHLLGNLAFILLLGPILEEKYGSRRLLIMIAVTALITGILNVILLPTGLMGASGIVFMMIILVSFTNIQEGEIPLTFILILILYLAQEVLKSFGANNVSEFAHILGGLTGSLFGFTRGTARKQKE